MKIKELKRWSKMAIRKACIKHGLYTAGDCDEYERMLDLADGLTPDANNIWFVACDIVEHSEDQTVENVMFILANEAVTTHFEIEEA